MTLYYSASTHGFYDDKIHPANKIPDDVILITSDHHKSLLDQQASGKMISADCDGNPITLDRPEATKEELADLIREKRNSLLKKTDYLMMSDYPIESEKLAVITMYRQALRDITKQIDFPTQIIWPEQPV